MRITGMMASLTLTPTLILTFGLLAPRSRPRTFGLLVPVRSMHLRSMRKSQRSDYCVPMLTFSFSLFSFSPCTPLFFSITLTFSVLPSVTQCHNILFSFVFSEYHQSTTQNHKDCLITIFACYSSSSLPF